MTTYTIEQAALCDTLAKDLYDTHARFYQMPVPEFSTLSYRTKKLWIERALEAIEAVGPSKARVLATITPEAPWGVSA